MIIIIFKDLIAFYEKNFYKFLYILDNVIILKINNYFVSQIYFIKMFNIS